MSNLEIINPPNTKQARRRRAYSRTTELNRIQQRTLIGPKLERARPKAKAVYLLLPDREGAQVTGRLGGGLLLATGHLLRALDRRAEEDEVLLVGVHFPATIGAGTGGTALTSSPRRRT